MSPVEIVHLTVEAVLAAGVLLLSLALWHVASQPDRWRRRNRALRYQLTRVRAGRTYWHTRALQAETRLTAERGGVGAPADVDSNADTAILPRYEEIV